MLRRQRQLCERWLANESAIARPDGTLLGYQPYGVAGLLVADLDLAAATCLLARRYRDVGA